MIDQNALKYFYSLEKFNDARTAFIERYPQIDNKTRVDLLEYFSNMANTAEEYLIVLEFYELLNSPGVKLLNYIRQCPFQDDNRIKTKRIALERKYGDIETALELIENCEHNEYNRVQKAAILNQIGEYDKAREIIENSMFNKITGHKINTYAAIINNILKRDDDARRLCIPNLTRSICQGEYKNGKTLDFDFKRLLRKIIEFEDTFGDKRNKERTEKILNLFIKTGIQ